MTNLREHIARACRLVMRGRINGASWYWFNQLPEDKQQAIGSELQFCTEVKHIVDKFQGRET